MAYTTIDNPKLFFDVLTWTGDGSTSLEVNGLDFQPDWVWAKLISHANDHYLADSVRGVNKKLESDETAVELEDDTYGYLTSFDNDGFSTQKGSGTFYNFNSSADEFVAWCWKTGTSFSNDASATSVGDIDSSGSVNTDAGISIVSYTGNGTSGTEVAHGLGSTPDLYITKSRSYDYGWGVYHKDIANDKGFFLHANDAELTGTGFRDSTAPTSSVFTLGGGSQPYRYTSNKSGETYIGYFFNEVKGYSKFGSYTGNGSTDGTFVYTGFRPAWVMIKRINSANNWLMFDNKRNGHNPLDKLLYADLSSAEATQENLDFTASGFKCRGSGAKINTSGGTYIYMAFAEAPLVNSKGVPCNAR